MGKETLARPDQPVQRGPQAQLLMSQVQPDQQGRLGLPGPLDLQDPRDPLAQLARMARQALPGRLALQDLPDLQGFRALLALVVPLVQLAVLVLLARQEIQVHKA